MQGRLLGTFLLSWLAAAPLFGQEEGRARGPLLLARSDRFFVHAVPGGSDGGFYEQTIQSGVALTLTSRADGRMETLLGTGIHSIPTRRISYNARRILGTAVDGDHFYCLLYQTGRLWDRPPYTLPAEGAAGAESYRLLAVDLRIGQGSWHGFHFQGETAAARDSVEIPHAASLPAEILTDRFEDGLLRRAAEGELLFFGCRFTLENGVPVKVTAVEGSD